VSLGEVGTGEDAVPLDNVFAGAAPAASGAYPSYAISAWELFDEHLAACGASVIHEDLLLSAAHCYGVFEPGQKVCIGGNQVNCSDASDIRTVKQHYIYPEFDINTLLHDIMLVKLHSPTSTPFLVWNTKTSNPEEGSASLVIGYGDRIELMEEWHESTFRCLSEEMLCTTGELPFGFS